MAPLPERAPLQAVLETGFPSWDTDGLLLRLGGDPDLAAECAEIFCTDAGERLTQIAADLGGGDVDRLGRQFHSLKGAAGTAGAERFAHLAAWAERAVAAGMTAGIVEVLQAMNEELHHVRSAVLRFRADA